MNITLFHDYEPDGSIRPVWLTLDFGIFGVPWTQKKIYFDASKYKVCDVHDFIDDVIGCQVHLNELMLTHLGENYIGINLNAIEERLTYAGIDPIRIERFIIQVRDIDEVLAVNQIL
jgi:hypothetical protein